MVDQNSSAPDSIMGDMHDLLEAAWEIQGVAEARGKAARDELFRVAQKLCAAKLDQKRQSANWTAPALADLIINEVGRELDELIWLRSQQQAGNTQATQLRAELQRQIDTVQHERQTDLTRLAEAQAEIERIKGANAGYEQDLARLRLEKQAAEARVFLAQAAGSHLAPVAMSASPSVPLPTVAAEPPDADWLATWSEARTFPRESGFIQMLGEVLECRRESLLKTFFLRYGQEQIDPTGSTYKDMMRRLEDLGLIEQIKVSGLQPGEPPKLVRLTAKGCAAYRFLVKREPLLGYEMLLARHTNAQQVYLVLEALDLLALEHYTVDLLPAMTQLADHRHFDPDIVATRGHERICVEVETDAEYKNGGDRQNKWQIMAIGTGGQIYVVTRTLKSMNRLRGEIKDQHYSRTVMLHLTNLEQARETFAQKNTIWVDERPIS